MAGFVENPRRSPRVPVQLQVDIGYGSAAWRGTTDDLSPSGCLVMAARPLPERASISLIVRSDNVVDRLSVAATVAWVRGLHAGMAFSGVRAGTDPRQWFRQLLQAFPPLQEAMSRTPMRIPLDARLSIRTGTLASATLSPDEVRLMGFVREGSPVGIVALHARLPPDRFVRALFALFERRVLTSPGLVHADPTELGSDAGSGAGLVRAVAGAPHPTWATMPPDARAERAALHDGRLAAEIALATRDR